jgi:hypothetical protein
MVDTVLLDRRAFALGKTGIMPQCLLVVAWPGVMACVLFMAACGGSASPVANTPSAVASAPTPTAIPPTPTPDVRAVAAQQYLAAVGAYNTVNDAFNATIKRVPSTAPWSALVPAVRTIYAAETAFERTVFAIHFPPDMAADTSTIVSATNSDLVAQSNFISDPSQSSWGTWTAASTATGSASNAMRHDLGLPPLPLAAP